MTDSTSTRLQGKVWVDYDPSSSGLFGELRFGHYAYFFHYATVDAACSIVAN
jgi:hypothetical protein